MLIEGETGTGKELIAQAIHRDSPCKDGPFVPFNCVSIPEGLLESELFGHARGAFTGASEQKTGLFVAVNGGTLIDYAWPGNVRELRNNDVFTCAKVKASSLTTCRKRCAAEILGINRKTIQRKLLE